MTDFHDRDDDAVFEALGQALPRVSPPDELLSRILAATQHITADPLSALRPPSRRRRWLPVAAAMAAAAAVAAAITAGLETGSGPGAVAARAALAGQNGITGQAVLYRPGAYGGEIRLELRGVPIPARGTHYELWLLPRGSTKMTATAAFTPADRTVDLLLPLPAPGEYKAFEISVQRDSGSPQRSSTSLVSGTFSASN